MKREQQIQFNFVEEFFEDFMGSEAYEKMHNYVFFKSIDLLQITWSFNEFP